MNSDDEYDSDDIIDDESITSEEEQDDEISSENEAPIDQHQISFNETNQHKAEALKRQIGLWDALLELRIKLQRATVTANCLPTTDVPENDELHEVMEENSTLVRKTLALLLAMDGSRSKKRGHDDLEDDDNSPEQKIKPTNGQQTTTDLFKKLSKRLKGGEKVIDEEIEVAYDRFAPERDQVVQEWYERARGFAKQSKTSQTEQSPISQIKEIMSFPDRLIKRTQTARIDYDFVCPPSSPNTNGNQTDSNLIINPHVFDDGDFYHQILREYIERKTSSITDPEQISKHYAQLRKLRHKMKKNVDTRASKDRKIRYNVHKKLVNYMAPIDRCSFTDEAKSDLFSSLFGAAPTADLDVEPSSPVNDIRII